MLIGQRAVSALQSLRLDLQESAAREFPQSVLKEMLLLYDVCMCLDLSSLQTQTVLGAPAYRMVTDYINSPVGTVAIRQ